MPFVGRKNGEIVTPEEVDDDTKVACLACDGELKPRSAHERSDGFVARHFWHTSQSECQGAGGGESYKHRKMKSIAVSKAKERWPEATVETEVQIADRRGDVLVEFDGINERYGSGIAIEAQHKNEEKNIQRVSIDFIKNDYSVLWLYEDDYDKNNVNFDGADWRVWWPDQIPSEPNWSGYHGVVHWLKQTKPTSAQRKIPLPPIRENKRSETFRVVWKSWADAKINERDGIEHIHLPCARCKSPVKIFAEPSYTMEVNSIDEEIQMTDRSYIDFAKESTCDSCGVKNGFPDKSINLKTGTPKQSVKDKIRGSQSQTQIQLPCPKCQSVVQFDCDIKHTASHSHPWAEIDAKTAAYCANCDICVRWCSVDGNFRFTAEEFPNETEHINPEIADS